MTRPKPTYPEPRVWSAYQAAARLGMSENKFKKALPGLQAAGFPGADELVGGYDAAAIEKWLDLRSQITTSVGEQPDGALEKWTGSAT